MGIECYLRIKLLVGLKWERIERRGGTGNNCSHYMSIIVIDINYDIITTIIAFNSSEETIVVVVGWYVTRLVTS